VVGLVVVSHSRGLAEGVVELARQMAGDVRIAAAGGTDEGGIGTDAVLVMAAIEEAQDGDGVLVLMDLGSAILSTETALELLGDQAGGRVLLSPAPLVEGAVSAAVAAQGGATLEEVAAEALGGARPKAAQLGSDGERAEPEAGERAGEGWRAVELAVPNAQGLHARPAARLVQAARGFDAEIELENLSAGRGPASARSLNGVATLGVRRGERIRIRARGAQAQAALEALRALVEAGLGEGHEEMPAAARAAPAPAPAAGSLRGSAAAPGVAVGPARHLRRRPVTLRREAGTPEQELEALERALARVREDVAGIRERVARRAGEAEAAIFDAHALLLDDDELAGAAVRGVREGRPADAAWSEAVAGVAARFRALDDDYQRARVADVEDVGAQVLAALEGAQAEAAPAAAGILLAAELTPAQTGGLDPDVVRAIATAGGTRTSHSAILARSLGVPAVVGLGARLLAVEEGTRLLVDGDGGAVYVDPPEELVARHERRLLAREEAGRAAGAAAAEPARTRDGRLVEVAANIGGPGDVEAAMAAGADGVGLLRTEFLFLDRPQPPGEEEQRAAYARIADALEGRRLVVRTLDAGADKPLAGVSLEREQNPFLGVRGIRLSLLRPELLRTQLRAVLAVAAGAPVAVMFPMVATLAELRAARAHLEEARAELAAEGAALPEQLETGIMVEVPSAALIAERLAPEVDFFSIGTNDLTQYALAAERGNAGVAALADGLHPALLRLVGGVCAAARGTGAWVAVCGELAGDPLAAPLLVGLGVSELSMAPAAIPWLKQAVRSLDAAAASDLAAQALDQSDGEAVRRLVRAHFGDALRAAGLAAEDGAE
jgi:multiphosphoryl transfer protein